MAKKKTATPKPGKARKAKPAADAGERLSALDAAALVLAGHAGTMSAPELVEELAARKLWASPSGKTPAATRSAAIGREIKAKGQAARFVKTGRGRFGGR